VYPLFKASLGRKDAQNLQKGLLSFLRFLRLFAAIFSQTLATVFYSSAFLFGLILYRPLQFL
jgi:hypothetical protein